MVCGGVVIVSQQSIGRIKQKAASHGIRPCSLIRRGQKNVPGFRALMIRQSLAGFLPFQTQEVAGSMEIRHRRHHNRIAKQRLATQDRTLNKRETGIESHGSRFRNLRNDHALREGSGLISGQPDVLCFTNENEVESWYGNRKLMVEANRFVKMGNF